MSYEGVEEQMSRAGLSPFVNCWREVHNSTPETAKHTVTVSGGGGGVVSSGLMDKWRQLLLRSPDVLHSLTLHPMESFLIHQPNSRYSVEGRETIR